jgi:hypothetical protein
MSSEILIVLSILKINLGIKMITDKNEYSEYFLSNPVAVKRLIFMGNLK